MHDATLLLELGGVILTLGILGRLAGLVGFSPIPLYLVAGLAFGDGGLLPLATSEQFISVGAEVGVVLLLLTLGLEYTATELIGGLRAQAPVGGVDVVLNAAPGVVLALVLGWGPLAAVVLGGVTYISSSGIIAKVLDEMGHLGNRETPVILAVLVLEDLAMALYLPIVTALLAHQGVLRGSLAVVIALVAVSVVLLLALRHGERISRLVFNERDEVLLLQVLGMALLVAGLAQRAQVSAAVGAFLVGIALSGQAAEGARELLLPLRDLFAAVFFVFFGLQTDPAAIPPVLLPAVILAVVTASTKIGTGWWAAWRSGIGRLGRVRAGTALVARGEFSIVIAGLAVSAGEEPKLGPLAAAYVLLMAVAGPIAARVGEPVARRVLRLPPPARAPRRRAAGRSGAQQIAASSPAESPPAAERAPR